MKQSHKTYHIYPLNDKLEHNTNSDPCICHPKIDIYSSGNKIVIHNSFDCREYKEIGSKLEIN